MHALTYNPGHWSNVRIRRMILMRGYCLPSRLMPWLFAPLRFPGAPDASLLKW